MLVEVINYSIGALIVSNCVVVWFHTNIAPHLYDIFFFNKKEKFYVRSDWETYVVLHWGYFGELLNCPLCFASHISWAVGIALWQINGMSPWIILLGTFSWPLISYIFYKKI
jgi:hypothetical protein